MITGGGIVTALGCGWTVNAEGFREGNVAFGPVRLFDASRQRTRRAAEVVLPETFERGGLSPRRLTRMDRAGRLLLMAAREAAAQADLARGPFIEHETLPVVLATTSAGMNRGQEFFRAGVTSTASRRGQATRVSDYFVCRQTRDLADDLGWHGPVTVIANACASGANAVGHAWEWLRSGRGRRAIAGGYDALSELVFSGFDALQALSPTVCRPFDRDRDGLGLGEGAAVLVLETLESARERGATIRAELIGYGCSTDVHHLTQPHPQGVAAVASMTEAARAAGISPDAVGYINAHGTGTPLNDSSEAIAIRTWAGSHVDRLPVSSTKSSVGHLLGAAGAVEAAVCVMALQGRWLPPTTTHREPDPECRFPVVTVPTSAPDLEVALSNSFGFGGSNATLAFRRWRE
ncbi:MAG: beta-ketoacyl synthase [Limisphaerales bacterium]